MEKVYIFGHQKPDTDSITSAISLSYLKNKLGMHTVPARLGEINDETKYVLKYFNVNENNDIYIYLEKNSAYGKTEIIDSVELKDIKAIKEKDIGKIKFYKPVTDEKRMFINQADSEMLGITYKGEMESNIKEQKISNQGGIVAFRYGINNISKYVSENDEQIDHSQLLKLTNITQEDLQANLSFDMIINLNSGKKYQAPISFDIPTDEIIEKGTVGIDKTDLNNIIFKRIEN